MADNKKVLVFGSTGPIGTSLIETISKERPNWTIVAVSRSGKDGKSRLADLKLPNVDIVKGDAENLAEVQELSKGVDIVYSCIGFVQYERKYWSEHWPVVVDNLLAVTSNTRPLIFCDNLYAYGPTTDISTSTTPVEASTKSKPAIRAMLRQTFQQRMQEQPQSLTVVGGADFFGPHVTAMSFLGDTFVGNMAQHQKKPMAIGSATVIHDFCYVKDFANALFVASTNPLKSMGKFWICPHSIHNKTMTDIAQHVNKHLTTKVEGIQVIPAWVVKTLAIFMPFMREMKEMLPFWTANYSIKGDEDFLKTFKVKATPMDQALKETVEFFQEQSK